MHTPRIFVDQSIKLSDVVTLDGSKAHHLAHVLKMRVADPLIIFNGSGGEFRAKVIDVKKDRLQVHIEQHDPVNRESELRINGFITSEIVFHPKLILQNIQSHPIFRDIDYQIR